MALVVGQSAPDFSLPSTAGRDFQLSVHLAEKACILYFYPKDFTNVCTAEACGFRDQFAQFRQLDLEVIGISRDSLLTHLRFKESYTLPFELLADEKGSVCALYDALIPIIRLPKRITYLLDQNHVIRAVYDQLFDPAHSRMILEKSIQQT